MKISIEIDCTPIEARQFLGLPNVEPMQAVMLAKLEKRMSEEIDRFSPEALMKSWVGLFPEYRVGSESLRDLHFGEHDENEMTSDQ
jgi:Family of unknown function (DUF6489)